jgi:hypothetical protein
MLNDLDDVLHALELSLASHHQRADGGCGMKGCALCDLYHDVSCSQCPIGKLTSRAWCEGSPYHRTIEQREQVCIGKCPSDCVYIESCSNGETAYCIVEEENEIAFLKWVRYNLKMGWI